MAKFYAMGNYTAKAFQGFIKDPTSDRSKAAKAAGDAVGAKIGFLRCIKRSVRFYSCV